MESQVVNSEPPPCEQIETCLANLFDVPTKNIECAFQLILGLLKSQSSKIDRLKFAHDEALELRTSMQNDVDKLAREKDELSQQFQKLSTEHAHLRTSYDTSLNTVDELKNELETLTFNLLGDDGLLTQDERIPSSNTKEVDIEEEQPAEEVQREIVDFDAEQSPREIIPNETNTVETVECIEIVDPLSHEEADASGDDEVCTDKEHTAAKPDSPKEESNGGALGKEEVEVVEVPCNITNDSDQQDISSFKDDVGGGGPTRASIGWGQIGRIGLAKVKVAKKAKVKLTPDKTVMVRLDKLEQSLASLMEDMSSTKPGLPTETESESRDDISRRIQAVETFLQGFGHDEVVTDYEMTKHEESSEKPAQETLDDEENVEEREDKSQPPQVEDSGANAVQDDSESLASTAERAEDDSSQDDHASTQLSRRGSLLFHLNERESRTDLSIDDLAQQISALRQNIEEQNNTNNRMPPAGFVTSHDEMDVEGIRTKITELGDELQNQLRDLVVSLDDKVSVQDFESRIHDICTTLAQSKSVDDTTTTRNESEHTSPSIIDDLTATVKEQIEQIFKLEVNKLDIDKFDQQIHLLEDGIKSLLAKEVEKQQNEMYAQTKKTENDLVEIKSLIDARHNVSLCEDANENTTHNVSSNDNIIQPSMKEEEVEERIRQALAITASLEERLDGLSAIEKELDSLTSQLAEKPSQDQIDSMLCDIEKRLGKGSDDMIQTMKMELQDKIITRGEVMTMVKQTIRETKLGIQNTKDSLMIGTTPAYCLGCSQAFPKGVNGIRARKTFDSLPPAGLVSNATLYGCGNGGRRTLRSSAQQRPKSAIIGRFSPSSSLLVQQCIETSRVLPSSR